MENFDILKEKYISEDAGENIETSKGSDTNIKHRFIVKDIQNTSKKTFYLIVKRCFDFLAAFFALIFLAIPMLIIAIVIKADSKGTALYKQERLGKNGKPFNVLKFRSMRMDAESGGAQWASADDNRVTRVGAFLRKTRLDELPQLICILCGTMSIVGPRPERPVFYNEFDKYIDGFRNRLYVTPGLTGLAQISGGYDLEPEEKIVYDMEYIETRSALLDLKIIFKTAAIVFNHDGAR
ncbi:MAG: sugar transferase [Clostridiales bacterium]|nr:sugar transferase [Clostridiales bacterium]